MTAIIEETGAPLPADAWRHAPDLARHTAPMRDELAALTEQFLAAGGTITQVATGATGPGAAPGTPPAPRTRQMDARDKADVDRLLGLPGRSRWEIAKAMGVSDDRVQRLLRLYLAEDERFDGARAVDVAAQQKTKDKAHLARVHAALAAGHVGLMAVARYCDMAPSTLRKLESRHRLNIPRAVDLAHNPCI